MAFKSWQGSRAYRPSDGDTLAVIADREAAAGNPITAEDIARFNWGTEDPEEIQTLMRDELGARARDGDKGYMLSGDDSPRSELRIPEVFEQRGFSLEQTHQVRVARKDCPEQFLDCCSLPAITFDFDSSFVKPAVVDHLGAIETLVQSYPDARLMVFGHTDAVGDEMYNKKLSERRAWAVYAFILNDPDAWETLYNHPDEEWGLPVVQEILADLGHYDGATDGDMGPLTRAAMRDFLGLGENASVSNDAAFRRELFAAYMGGKHDIEIEAERFMEPGFMGCGEFNLLEPTDSAEQKNRRVTFYAFNKDRLPNLPCAFADCGPCKNQMVSLENRHQEGFSCSFYDSWAKLCPCEGETRDIVVLFHTPDDAHALLSDSHDWFHLRSDNIRYDRCLYAKDATIVAPNRAALLFRETPLAGVFTLRRFYEGEADFPIFENLSHADLDSIGEESFEMDELEEQAAEDEPLESAGEDDDDPDISLEEDIGPESEPVHESYHDDDPGEQDYEVLGPADITGLGG